MLCVVLLALTSQVVVVASKEHQCQVGSALDNSLCSPGQIDDYTNLIQYRHRIGGKYPASSDSLDVDYSVSFRGVDGKQIHKPVYKDYCKDLDSNSCTSSAGFSATNNFASYTFQEGESAVKVTVTRTYGSREVASHRNVRIRPRYFNDDSANGVDRKFADIVQGVPTTATSSSDSADSVTFTVTQPCQLSVEVGGDFWFQDLDTYNKFDNLMLFFNPPKSKFPIAMPKISGTSTCTSSDNAHCILAPLQRPDSCIDIFEVPDDTDLFFASEVAYVYDWSTTCGKTPKKIVLGNRSRVFLDDDVIVRARVLSRSAEQQGQGVIGYGIFSNDGMGGAKTGSDSCNGAVDDECVSNTINLFAQHVQLWGFVSVQSTFRNIKVGPGSAIRWTKSFAWPSQTDCANLENYKPGVFFEGNVSYLVENNFFKNNDDCLKGYVPGVLYNMNIIWHQAVGRALMFNWGNVGENDHDITGLEYRNTFVIHDAAAYANPNVERSDAECTESGNQPWILGCKNVPITQMRQDRMEWYAAIICAIHSLPNQVGTVASPVHLNNLYLESSIGALLLLTNGYTLPDADWMGQPPEGQGVGNMHVLVDGLRMKFVDPLPNSGDGLTTAPNLVSGCATTDRCLCVGAKSTQTNSCSVDLDVTYTDYASFRAMTSVQFWQGQNAKINIRPSPTATSAAFIGQLKLANKPTHCMSLKSPQAGYSGDPLIFWDCVHNPESDATQNFIIPKPLGSDGSVQGAIMWAANPRYCLAVTEGKINDPDTDVQLWECAQGKDIFEISNKPDGTGQLRLAYSNSTLGQLCLEAQRGDDENGARVSTGYCSSGDYQSWLFPS